MIIQKYKLKSGPCTVMMPDDAEYVDTIPELGLHVYEVP